MEWTDAAIVLGARRQGESSLTISLLTRQHGRHKGLVRGGAKSRQRGLFEPGNTVTATWNARLAEHLGLLRLEPGRNVAALLMDDPLRLAVLEAAAALAEAMLPERVAHPNAYTALSGLLDALAVDDGYLTAHLRFELDLLSELGFGLDMASCAVTGVTTGLAYVSPRTGRAVSQEAAQQYRDRLLVLPRILGGTGQGGSDAADLLDGFRLTGFFLQRQLLAPAATSLPAARGRFVDRLARLV